MENLICIQYKATRLTGNTDGRMYLPLIKGPPSFGALWFNITMISTPNTDQIDIQKPCTIPEKKNYIPNFLLFCNEVLTFDKELH